MALAPVQQSQAMEPEPNASSLVIYEQLKNPAKWAAMSVFCPTLCYYFFHYPDDRRSQAPFENVLKGKWPNVIGDTFNWDNIKHFADIIPGQRHKVFPWTIKASELPDEKLLQFTTGNMTDIKGFGLYYFCEKNMNKICKLIAASATMYVLLWGNLPTKRDLLETLFDAYKKVPTQV